MSNELDGVWNEVVRTQSRYYPSVSLKGQKNTTTSLGQVCQYRGRDSKWAIAATSASYARDTSVPNDYFHFGKHM